MRKWMIGVLALAGSAFVAAPCALAQSEFGKPTWRGWFGEEDQYSFYTAPTNPNEAYIPPRPRASPPPMAPGYSYFSPPSTVPMEVGPGPGNCGEFFYWSDEAGACVDARTR